MKHTLLRVFALGLAFILTGTTNRPAPVGFADLPRLIAVHPLHGMLDTYDREIIALRRTLMATGLEDPAARAQNGAVAAQRESVTAQRRIERIPTSDARADAQRERSALAEALSFQHEPDRSLDAYRAELARETDANLRGFAAGIVTRNQRALAARRQQLVEKELTLEFDLARRDAAERLTLRVRLADLHLDSAARAKLQAELSALDRRHGAAVAAMRRDDEAALAAYARQLESQGAAADSAMSAQLRSKAAANLALRFRVVQAESNAASALPNLPARLNWFASTYRFTTDAAAITAGMEAARTDLTRRFAQVAAVDRNSRAQTNVQIERLQKNRQELYRLMAAQIVRAAQELAAQRHLRGVTFSGSRPRGSLDLTGALAAKLREI